MSTPPLIAATDVAARYAALLTGLGDAVWRMRGFFTVLVVCALGNYLNRTHLRFAALMARLAAGKLPRPRRRAAPVPPRPRTLAPETSFPYRFVPRARGWLLRTMLGTGHPHRHTLQTLLDDPEAQRLFVAVPTTLRYIRPLARMLRVDLPPSLQSVGRKPPAPRPPRARTSVRRTDAQRREELWYPNAEGKPIDLLLASRRMDPDRRRKRA